MPPDTLEEKLNAIRKIEHLLPGVIIIHDLSDSAVLYMSEKGKQTLCVSLEELRSMGTEYHSRYFNPEDQKDYGPKIMGLLEKNMDDELISYFQQVRPGQHSDWKWYLTGSMVFHRDESGRPVYMISLAVPVDAQHHIAAKAQRLLEENNFLRKNHHIFDSLTKREKEILRMIAMGCSSAEIGKKLHISSTTASTHRKNIKKKLQAKNNYELTKYAQAFDLI
jgi:DNA-binding CsgD family transcriptional regulator